MNGLDKKNSQRLSHFAAIVLIGMPGAGKSTVGRVLAQHLNRSFVDTDDLIAQRVGCSLHLFAKRCGYLALRKREEDILLSAEFSNAVVATGGSAVYSSCAMARLAKLGPCIYLRANLNALERRVDNFSTRGIAAKDGITIAQLYSEREPLYNVHAQFVIDTDTAGSAEEVVDRIMRVLLT